MDQLRIEPSEIEGACGKLAVAYYVEQVEKTPDDATTWAGFAGALLDAGRSDEAMEKAEKAIRLDADCLRAHLALSRAYYDCTDPFQAVVALEQIVAVQPGILYSHEDTAGPREAIDKLERAAATLRESSYLRQQIATLYLSHLNDRRRAIEVLWSAVELAPFPWGPWEKLEALLIEDGSWDEVEHLLGLLSSQQESGTTWPMMLEQESRRIEQLAADSGYSRRTSRFVGCCLPLLAPLLAVLGLFGTYAYW